MKYVRLSGTVIAVMSIAACGPVGSGDLVSEEREVGEFEGIHVSGGIDLDLTVDPAAAVSVTVVYDDNLLERIETEVEGTTLVIRSRGSYSVSGPGRLVEVTTPVLEELAASGGSDVNGSGTLDMLLIAASGGSDLDLSDLVAGSVSVNASGGSDVTVNVTEEVVGSASGGSDLTILGDPASQRIDVSGGADVNNE
jgi:hypothetical protein